MTQELLKILNPCRILKVKEDWIKMAAKIKNVNQSEYPRDTALMATHLMERYEQLTSQPLNKEMFVCEVEKPIIPSMAWQSATAEKLQSRRADYEINQQEYTKAQESLWFEGFELSNDTYTVFNSEFEIWFSSQSKPRIWFSSYEDCTLNKNPSLFDFIIEIDRYNRTATTPITINFTENFCKELLK